MKFGMGSVAFTNSRGLTHAEIAVLTEVLEVAAIKLCKFDYICRFSPAHPSSVTRSTKSLT